MSLNDSFLTYKSQIECMQTLYNDSLLSPETSSLINNNNSIFLCRSKFEKLQYLYMANAKYQPNHITVLTSEINSVPKALQLAAIARNPYVIGFVTEQTLELQLQAVRANPLTIEFINEPFEETQILAVRQEPITIAYLTNPSEIVRQFAEVSNNAAKIADIMFPSEELQIFALIINRNNIRYIKNPTEKIQFYAIDGFEFYGEENTCIRYIDNPTEDVQLAVVRKHPLQIKYIKQPTKKVIDTAIASIIEKINDGKLHKKEWESILKEVQARYINITSEPVQPNIGSKLIKRNLFTALGTRFKSALFSWPSTGFS